MTPLVFYQYIYRFKFHPLKDVPDDHLSCSKCGCGCVVEVVFWPILRLHRYKSNWAKFSKEGPPQILTLCPEKVLEIMTRNIHPTIDEVVVMNTVMKTIGNADIVRWPVVRSTPKTSVNWIKSSLDRIKYSTLQ